MITLLDWLIRRGIFRSFSLLTILARCHLTSYPPQPNVSGPRPEKEISITRYTLNTFMKLICAKIKKSVLSMVPYVPGTGFSLSFWAATGLEFFRDPEPGLTSKIIKIFFNTNSSKICSAYIQGAVLTTCLQLSLFVFNTEGEKLVFSILFINYYNDY